MNSLFDNKNKAKKSEESITEQLKWAQEYRSKKEKERRKSLVPKIPGINEEETWRRYQLTKKLEELKRIEQSMFAKPVPKYVHLQKLPLSKTNKVDRNGFTKKQYINFLSTPSPRYAGPGPSSDEKKDLKRKLGKQKCSARLEILAMPTSGHLIHTWKTYGRVLSTEAKGRFGELLSSDHNLNMQFAKCYFKSLDHSRRKQRAERRRQRRKRLRLEKRQHKRAFKKEIAKIADSISECIINEPLFTINYRQTLISDTIFKQLLKTRYITKIPSRTSKSVYKRTLVDLVDQVAVCIDIVGRHMDMKFLAKGKGGEPSILTEYELGMGQQEEEEAPHKREPFSLPPFEYPQFPPLPPYPDVAGPQRLVAIFEAGEEYEAGSSIGSSSKDFTSKDEDLDLLISILSRSPEQDMKRLINSDLFPGYTYEDVLTRIKELNNREKRRKEELRRNILKETLLVWAYENAAEDVDDDMKQGIFKAAEALSRCFSQSEVRP